MEDDTLKNQKPSRWVGGEGRWEASKFCERASVVEERKRRCSAAHRHCGKQNHFRRFPCTLWKGAEGKGEEINGGISHPVEQ